MTELERLADLANHLHQEEVDFTVPTIPFHARNGYHFSSPRDVGGYVCRDNGLGCGRSFPTKEAKNEHRKWCLDVQRGGK